MRPGMAKGPFVGQSAASAIPVPTPASPGAFPYAFKYSFTHLDFQTAGLTNQVLLVSLPARGKVSFVSLKPSIAFAGTAITDYALALGIASDIEILLNYYSVIGGVSGTNFSANANVYTPNYSAATSLYIGAQSVGANLNASTAGAVDVWIEFSQLP